MKNPILCYVFLCFSFCWHNAILWLDLLFSYLLPCCLSEKQYVLFVICYQRSNIVRRFGLNYDDLFLFFVVLLIVPTANMMRNEPATRLVAFVWHLPAKRINVHQISSILFFTQFYQDYCTHILTTRYKERIQTIYI